MEATIYHLPEKEVHILGKYVGIVWNTVNKKKTLKDASGFIYVAYVPLRNGNPYIDFLWIREIDGEMFEDENSPVDGGLNAEQALQVSRELALAVEYLKTVSEEK